MSASCITCGSSGREALELARLRVKHQTFAEQTNRLLTEQAAEITALRDQLAAALRAAVREEA